MIAQEQVKGEEIKSYLTELNDELRSMDVKVLSARAETLDREDIEVLIAKLGLNSADEAVNLVKNYYPNKQIKPRARIMLEEIFAKR